MADRSRMNREVHVRSLGGAGGETPPVYSTPTSTNIKSCTLNLNPQPIKKL